MDIEGQLRKARQAGVEADIAAAAEAERIRTETEASIRMLREAFREFIDALVRHDVPQRKLVWLEKAWIPERRGMFKSKPGHTRMSAMALGWCWPFGKTLIFDDGSILDATGVKAGSQIVPYGSTGPGFLELARPALRAAGLGDDLSNDCLYIVKGDPRIDQLSEMDWSTVSTAVWINRSRRGISLRVHADEYVVSSGELLVMRSFDDEMGPSAVLLDQVIAGYIHDAKRGDDKPIG